MNPEQNFHEKCICEVCKCGKHKCPKPHGKGDFTTSYEKDYPKHSNVEHHTPKKSEVYEAKHYDPKDLVSNYQGQYIAKGAVARQSNPQHPKNFVLPESGFQGQSSYNNSYKGFDGKYQDLRAQVLRNMNTIEKNPFQGQSTYNANYMGAASQKPEKVVMKNSLELAKGSFDGVSTYQGNYTQKPNSRPDLAERPKSRKDLIKNDNNFTDMTSYTASYVGSPGDRNQKFIPKGQLSVGGHQFEGNSNYSDNYRGIKPERRGLLIPQSGAPVIPVGSFQGDSTYISSYLASKVPRTQAYRPKETPLAQGSFNGVSTYSDHYIPTGPSQNVQHSQPQHQCPAVALNAPTYNLLDQQHLKYNSNLKMWT